MIFFYMLSNMVADITKFENSIYPYMYMKCGDNELCSTSKVWRKNTKNQEQSKHGPLQNLEAGSGAMEMWTSSTDLFALCPNQEICKIRRHIGK